PGILSSRFAQRCSRSRRLILAIFKGTTSATAPSSSLWRCFMRSSFDQPPHAPLQRHHTSDRSSDELLFVRRWFFRCLMRLVQQAERGTVAPAAEIFLDGIPEQLIV